MDTVVAIAQVVGEYPMPPMFIAIIVGVPSLVLYVMEVAVLFSPRGWKKFNSAFFRLFLTRAIVNIVNYFDTYVQMRFGRMGLFLPAYVAMGNFGIAVSWFLNYHLYHCENIATAFILLNRFTIIAYATSKMHDLLWDRLLPWVIAIVLLGPLPITWTIFAQNYFVHYSAGVENATFTEDIQPGYDSTRDCYYAGVSAVLFCVVCLALNVVSILAYQRATAAAQPGMNAGGVVEKRSVERRLTLYAFYTFVAQLLMAVVNMLIYVSVSLNSDLIFFPTFNLFPLMNDICTVVLPAWLILWASTDIRQALWRSVLSIAPTAWTAKLSSSGPTAINTISHQQTITVQPASCRVTRPTAMTA